jgi:NAD(P)-dependent dehydrogenase (short-subunit alcohol dehydrogenase family)
MRFRNKVAIITGSSSGIGRATALAFVREGGKVVITSRNKRSCEQVAKEVENAGGECIVWAGDISNEKDVSQLVKATLKAFGKIDILVNNAGIFWMKPIEKMSLDDWEQMIHTNLRGAFLLCKYAVPHLKSGAAIVNVASVLGTVGAPTATAYCASKGGLIMFTKALALELAPRNIRVNAVNPGPIETPMTAGLSKADRKEFTDFVPLGRFGQPGEVANAILFLASGEASYVNGSCVFVDGGGTAH